MLCLLQLLLQQAAAEDGAAAAAAAADRAPLPPSSPQQLPSDDDEGLALHMLPYLVMGLSFIVCLQLFRSHETGSILCKFLGDNIAYWTMPTSSASSSSSQAADDSSASPSSSPGLALQAASQSPGSKKKVRKMQQQQQQQMAASQQSMGLLQAGYLGPQLLSHLEFTENVDNMIRYAAFVTTVMVFAILMRLFLTPRFPVQPNHILMTGTGFLLFTLYKVEWAHVIIGRDEKAYMLAAAVLGASTCFSLLVWAPAQALAFDMAGASEEASSRIRALVLSKFKSLPLGEMEPIADAGPLGALMALIGGALAGLLMAPGIRYGRLLQAFLEPPTWVVAFRPKPAAKLMAQAAFALQLLLTGLWVTPLTDVLRLPAAAGGALPYLRGVWMLVVAVLQALTVPRLLQAFLYSTPLHAHIVTKNPAVSDELRAKSVKKVTQITLSQASKVCVQLLVVPILLLSCSLGYLLMSFPSPLAATSPFAREWDKRPSVCIMSVAGFVGWWSSSVYMFWASLGCVLSRLNSAALAA